MSDNRAAYVDYDANEVRHRLRCGCCCRYRRCPLSLDKVNSFEETNEDSATVAIHLYCIRRCMFNVSDTVVHQRMAVGRQPRVAEEWFSHACHCICQSVGNVCVRRMAADALRHMHARTHTTNCVRTVYVTCIRLSILASIACAIRLHADCAASGVPGKYCKMRCMFLEQTRK